uniref:ABC1 atypical kinase-like domain-containing protein n=1 Tax=Chenopodium quinoa TaxID=63459 RepID=A0A803LXV8_CHEQI
MRHAAAILRYHRHAPFRSRVLPFVAWRRTWQCLSLREWNGPRVNEDLWFPSIILQKYCFSTSFNSVHGERPSAEYARQRKQSLEEEFGHVLGSHSSKSVSVVYRFGPFLALFRAAVISYHVLKLSAWQLFVHDIHKRATKLGQALSTRPDILPTIYCQELSKLQDQIPPFPTSVAMRSIETQLGAPVSEIFADISPEPIASASLGQVYKGEKFLLVMRLIVNVILANMFPFHLFNEYAVTRESLYVMHDFNPNIFVDDSSDAAHLHSGELVAVKVQRPGMSLSLTLDALLFHMIGGQLKRFAKARKDLLVAVNEMVRHMFEEIDYILEGENAERFASLYASHPGDDSLAKKFDATTGNPQTNRGQGLIRVPKIYWKYTRKAVLTLEWINGIKLTNEEALAKLQLPRKELVDQGLYCSLRQLLEVGFFHADPHPGNLVATDDGSLAYFDFGMMGNIPRHYRVGLIQVLVHFVNRDSLGLVNDFLSLGFLPEGVDILLVSNALQTSFGDGTRQSRDFQSIMNQLYDVMYEFNFSLPPDYALVIRALGSLEGTAKALDPDFKVVESAYPYVIGRLLADPSRDMRKILRELVIRNDGSIRWNRLERLVWSWPHGHELSISSGCNMVDASLFLFSLQILDFAFEQSFSYVHLLLCFMHIVAISEAAFDSAEQPHTSEQDSSNPLRWKSFNMRSVVGATEDLLLFILSENGLRIRMHLTRDILQAVDAFLQDAVADQNSYGDFIERKTSEEHSRSRRVANGFHYFWQAVKKSPEAWISMLARMSIKPEFHNFILDIASVLMQHSSRKVPETTWILFSKSLHNFVDSSKSNNL